MGRKQELIVPGRYEEIRTVCQFMADGAAAAGLDDTAIFHIELACDEACTNIIEHAYDGEDVGNIVASWQVTGDRFTMTLRDNGRSFDPGDIPTPTITEAAPSPTTDDLKVGGLGIHFMRQLMDEIEFQFDDIKGNTLVMVKRIPDGKS